MKYFLILISIFTWNLLFAQEHTFTVLASKGENKVLSNGSEYDIIAGCKLKKSDIVIISTKGYLGLLHKNGTTLELRDEKKISVSRLENQLSPSQINTYSIYKNFLFNNSSKQKNNYNITSGVERGESKLMLIANERTAYIKEIPLNIYWKKYNSNKKSIITPLLKDFTVNEKEHEIICNDTIVKIDFSEIKQEILNLEINNSISNHKANTILYPVEKNKASNILNEYNQLLKTLDQSNAVDLMILTSFFDENNLPQYATSTLLDIIQLEQDNSVFIKLLNTYVTTPRQ